MVLANKAVGAEVLVRWEAAEAIIREEGARWPELQQLLLGVARTHQQLRSAAAHITTSASNAAARAAAELLWIAARNAAAAASASIFADVTDVAPLAQDTVPAAADAAVVTVTVSMQSATPLPAGDQSRGRAARSTAGGLQAGHSSPTGAQHTEQGPDTAALAKAFGGMHT
jgi:hypothetical protein